MTTLQYGDLEISVTHMFTRLWHDAGSGADKDGAFWSPDVGTLGSAQGWRVLAHVGRGSHEDISSGKVTTVLARDLTPAKELLKEPVDYELVAVWGPKKGPISFPVVSAWRPVPPPGYVSLGDVVVLGLEKPGLGRLTPFCVRKEPVGEGDGVRSYVREAEIGDVIWDDRGSGSPYALSAWSITTPGYPTDNTERLLLGVDGLITGDGYHKPARSVYVLDLPAIVDKQYPPAAPVLTSHEMPAPRETPKITDRAVVVPCTLVTDSSKTAQWQVDNSPFYILERRANYYCQMHYDNSQGSSEQEPTDSVTTGLSTEKSEEFSKRTSVTVTASAGIEVKGFSASLEVSVAHELGYSSRYGITQFEERTQTWTMKVEAFHSAALWSPRHEIIAIRQDGDPVGGRGGLAFDVDSRIYTQFPPPKGEPVQPVSEAIIAGDAQPFGDHQSQIPGYTGY